MIYTLVMYVYIRNIKQVLSLMNFREVSWIQNYNTILKYTYRTTYNVCYNISAELHRYIYYSCTVCISGRWRFTVFPEQRPIVQNYGHRVSFSHPQNQSHEGTSFIQKDILKQMLKTGSYVLQIDYCTLCPYMRLYRCSSNRSRHQ